MEKGGFERALNTEIDSLTSNFLSPTGHLFQSLPTNQCSQVWKSNLYPTSWSGEMCRSPSKSNVVSFRSLETRRSIQAFRFFYLFNWSRNHFRNWNAIYVFCTKILRHSQFSTSRKRSHRTFPTQFNFNRFIKKGSHFLQIRRQD